MVKVKEDLTGKTFGRWLVIEQAEDYINLQGIHYAQWLCECSCENHTRKIIQQGHLRHGKSLSCGCYNKERIKETHKKENKSDLSGEFGVLWTSNTNKEVYFDLENANDILKYCWYEDSCGYASTTIDGKTIRLHVFLGYKWHDHHNRNKLDNREQNLVLCTIQENNRNSSIRQDNKSGIIGVNWDKSRNKWWTQIAIDSKTIPLGRFTNKDDAIKTRLEAEAKYYGEFAPQRHLFEEYNITVGDDNHENI